MKCRIYKDESFRTACHWNVQSYDFGGLDSGIAAQGYFLNWTLQTQSVPPPEEWRHIGRWGWRCMISGGSGWNHVCLELAHFKRHVPTATVRCLSRAYTLESIHLFQASDSSPHQASACFYVTPWLIEDPTDSKMRSTIRRLEWTWFLKGLKGNHGWEISPPHGGLMSEEDLVLWFLWIRWWFSYKGVFCEYGS